MTGKTLTSSEPIRVDAEPAVHHAYCTGFMTIRPVEGHIYPTCERCDGRCSAWNHA